MAKDALALVLQLIADLFVVAGAAPDLGTFLVDRTVDQLQLLLLTEEHTSRPLALQLLDLPLQLGQRIFRDKRGHLALAAAVALFLQPARVDAGDCELLSQRARQALRVGSDEGLQIRFNVVDDGTAGFEVRESCVGLPSRNCAAAR